MATIEFDIQIMLKHAFRDYNSFPVVRRWTQHDYRLSRSAVDDRNMFSIVFPQNLDRTVQDTTQVMHASIALYAYVIYLPVYVLQYSRLDMLLA